LSPCHGAPVSPSRLFRWLRQRLFHNGLHLLWRRSRLRLALIVVFSTLLWVGLYRIFLNGLHFLYRVRTFPQAQDIADQFLEMFFGLFFLSLTGLMAFSGGLLLYGSLFRSSEAGFLLSTPAPTGQIFAHKFQETLFYSGWGFLLLGTPLLIAYGVEANAPWYYYGLFLLYLYGFLLFTSGLGALGCLLIVGFLPRQRKQFLYLLGILLLAVLVRGGLFFMTTLRPAHEIDQNLVEDLIVRLQPTQWWFLPSRWMTRGIMELAAGDLPRAMLGLLTLFAAGAGVYLLCTWLAGRWYRRAFNLIAESGTPRRRFGPNRFDRALERLLGWADPRTRLFLIKDLRIFRRDPVQWGQVVILGGLMLLSFLSIPSLPQSSFDLHHRSLVALLNVTILSLMLATYTSRFVFPLISLEGNKFWILGLLPLEREQLLRSKFVYAATFTVGSGVLLALLSELLLRMPWPILVLHVLTVLVVALGLCGLSVGLGAFLVNLKENNPAKIATGFGGTVNLLTSLAFLLLVVALGGVPTLLYFQELPARQSQQLLLEQFWPWFFPTLVLLIVVGMLAVIVPMRLGMRAFRRMEF
jgi:ABC-2 type transport system permease protein